MSSVSSGTIELVQGSLMNNAEKLGICVAETLKTMVSRHKNLVRPRGLGLMRAVDVVSKRTGKLDPKGRQTILQSAFERGLILLPCGESAIRFCPPLSMNETQLDVGLKIFDEVLDGIG